MTHDMPELIYAGLDEPQPDWREEKIDQDDDEDPVPYSKQFLRETLGFDPDEEEESEDEKNWVTTEDGQHVWLGPGGEFQPHGPSSHAASTATHETTKPSAEPAKKPEAKPATSAMPETPHKQFTQPGQKVTLEHEQGMQKWQQEHYNGWHKSLSATEKAGVEKYLGSAHEGMNGMLRNPKLADSYEALHPGSKEAVKGAAKALSKASAPETFTAYRGVRNAESAFGANMKVGSVSHDAGFMSMSQDHRVASAFLKGGTGNVGKEHLGAIVRVTVPKGSKVAGVSMNESNVKTSEHEMLAAPGHGLRITKITKKGGKTYIDAELMPPKGKAA